MKEKVPFTLRAISIFFFLVAIFYYFFGGMISGLAFLFGYCLAGSQAMISSEILGHVFSISKIISFDSFPFLTLIFGKAYLIIGLFGILGGVLAHLCSVCIIKRKKFGRYYAIVFGAFEIILALSLFSILNIITHLVVNGFILLYMIFSKTARDWFR